MSMFSDVSGKQKKKTKNKFTKIRASFHFVIYRNKQDVKAFCLQSVVQQIGQ